MKEEAANFTSLAETAEKDGTGEERPGDTPSTATGSLPVKAESNTGVVAAGAADTSVRTSKEDPKEAPPLAAKESPSPGGTTPAITSSNSANTAKTDEPLSEETAEELAVSSSDKATESPSAPATLPAVATPSSDIDDMTIEELKAQLKAEQASKATVQAQMEDLQTDNKILESIRRMDEQNGSFTQLPKCMINDDQKTQIQILTTRVEELELLLDNQMQRAATLSSVNKTLATQRQSLGADKEDLEASRQQLVECLAKSDRWHDESEHVRVEHALLALERDHKLLQQSYNQQGTELVTATLEVAALKRAQKEWQQRIVTLEAAADRLPLEELQAQLVEWQSNNTDLTEILEHTREEAALQQEQVLDLTDQIKRLTLDKELLEKKVAAKDTVKEGAAETDGQVKENDNPDDKNDETPSDRNEMDHSSMNNSSARGPANDDTIREWNEKVIALERSKHTLEQQFQTQVSELRLELAQAQASEQQLKSRVATYEREQTKLQTELAALKLWDKKRRESVVFNTSFASILSEDEDPLDVMVTENAELRAQLTALRASETTLMKERERLVATAANMSLMVADRRAKVDLLELQLEEVRQQQLKQQEAMIQQKLKEKKKKEQAAQSETPLSPKRAGGFQFRKLLRRSSSFDNKTNTNQSFWGSTNSAPATIEHVHDDANAETAGKKKKVPPLSSASEHFGSTRRGPGASESLSKGGWKPPPFFGGVSSAAAGTLQSERQEVDVALTDTSSEHSSANADKVTNANKPSAPGRVWNRLFGTSEPEQNEDSFANESDGEDNGDESGSDSGSEGMGDSSESESESEEMSDIEEEGESDEGEDEAEMADGSIRLTADGDEQHTANLKSGLAELSTV